MSTEHVGIGSDLSDAQVAEIFLHHFRVRCRRLEGVTVSSPSRGATAPVLGEDC